jgi:hypothetical protein
MLYVSAPILTISCLRQTILAEICSTPAMLRASSEWGKVSRPPLPESSSFFFFAWSGGVVDAEVLEAAAPGEANCGYNPKLTKLFVFYFFSSFMVEWVSFILLFYFFQSGFLAVKATDGKFLVFQSGIISKLMRSEMI